MPIIKKIGVALIRNVYLEFNTIFNKSSFASIYAKLLFAVFLITRNTFTSLLVDQIVI